MWIMGVFFVVIVCGFISAGAGVLALIFRLLTARGTTYRVIRRMFGISAGLLLLGFIGFVSASFMTAAKPIAEMVGGTTSGQMTLAKFNEIKMGMTYDEVVAIVGSRGDLEQEADVSKDLKLETYTFKGNVPLSSADLEFQNGKLTTKTQIGLK